MDERILTKEKCEVLTNCKYKGDFIFAFDNIDDRNIIEEKMKLWREYTNKSTKLYCFCGFDRNDKYDDDFWKQDIIDLMERIKILMYYGCLPYVMRHENYKNSPYKNIYTNIASWTNQPSFFKKMSFREFSFIDTVKRKYLSRPFEEFERENPDIAKEYFDLKYSELNKYTKKI